MTAALLASGAAVLFTALSGCRRGRPVPDASNIPLRGPNAYDVVKMCRFSDEEGPVWFAHALHADLVDANGVTIPCVRCHHELKKTPEKTPRACSKCHLAHDHFEARDLLTM
ncbi:MAG: cytochrome c3 family protein [Planctomycetota bacterium]